MPTSDPHPEDVRRFYDAYPFPGERAADQDGLILLRHLSQRAPPPLTILDAGCGTGNTAVSVARLLPEASVLGIDFCERSLEVARRTAAEAGLENLRFERRDLQEPSPVSDAFDVVLCLGVLHHTFDMPGVLRSLGARVRDTGDLYLWVYGRHGRYRHSLHVELLRMLLGREAPLEEAIGVAREFALQVDGGAVLRDLEDAAGDGADRAKTLDNDAWVADQFLHVHEELLTMPDLLDLLREAGLVLEEWLGLGAAPERRLGSTLLVERFARLPPSERFVALDLLLKPARYFLRARREGSP